MSTTIPVSRRVKEVLERLKGSKSWDEFLEELAFVYYRLNREKYREVFGEGFELDFKETRVKKWSREF